jgi:hypothetical protein
VKEIYTWHHISHTQRISRDVPSGHLIRTLLNTDLSDEDIEKINKAKITEIVDASIDELVK